MSVPRHLAILVWSVASLFAMPIDEALAQVQPPSTMEKAATTRDEAEIRSTLAAYNAALNGGRTDAVLPLYTANGICMAPLSPSHVGQAALREAYDGFFRDMKFDVSFDVLEVVVASPEWAFARTASAGTTLHRATGVTTAEANQELFVMRHGDDGRWRIARYSFSPIRRPGA